MNILYEGSSMQKRVEVSLHKNSVNVWDFNQQFLFASFEYTKKCNSCIKYISKNDYCLKQIEITIILGKVIDFFSLLGFLEAIIII